MVFHHFTTQYGFLWMALPALVQLGVGLYQKAKADSAISDLNKQPKPKYSLTPELRSAYDNAISRSSRGFDPDQEAAYQQQMSTSIAGARRNAMDQSGGNLSRAIGASLQAENIGANATHAAQGAELKQKKIMYADNLAQAIQRQQNLQSQVDIHQRQMQEEAYGRASSNGLMNIANGVGSLGATMYGQGATQGAGSMARGVAQNPDAIPASTANIPQTYTDWSNPYGMQTNTDPNYNGTPYRLPNQLRVD